MIWQTTRHAIDLATPRVMGIVNVTPDSFSDGRPGLTARQAIVRCEQLVEEGADILDIGGESTRPGAAPVAPEVELERVEPVLEGALRLGVPVSIDTHKPEVMRRALGLGCDIVNDVRALRATGALGVVAGHGRCGVCLMHMRGTPRSMRGHADYDDVVGEVRDFLAVRIAEVEAAGVARSRIVADPGIGFAKTPEGNLRLLERQRELAAIGVPLLVGWSRKSTLAKLAGVSARPPELRTDDDRRVLDAVSVAASVIAVERGARVVRVHDVAGTARALRVWRAASGEAGIIPPRS